MAADATIQMILESVGISGAQVELVDRVLALRGVPEVTEVDLHYIPPDMFSDNKGLFVAEVRLKEQFRSKGDFRSFADAHSIPGGKVRVQRDYVVAAGKTYRIEYPGIDLLFFRPDDS